MKHLVIGLGEIGKALQKILNAFGIDKDQSIEDKFNVIHICFPPVDNFVQIVKDYQTKYLVENGLTIIHSSVAVGTSRQCNAVHSPIRGVHPYLEDGIRKFVKYFGGDRAEEAAKIFSDMGISVYIEPKSETTELLKLWDTTQYGGNIVMEKECWKDCEKHNVPFDIVYTHANKTYNETYPQLGRPEVVRPNLKHMDGKIGGHCIIPNCKLLTGKVSEFIIEMNEQY